MSEHLSVCVVGQSLNEECDIILNSLTSNDISLLCLRLPGLGNIEKGNICDHHSRRFLKYFSTYEQKCVDPFNKHTRSVKTNLRIIDLQLVQDFKRANDTSLIPGQKVCTNCFKEIKNKIEVYEKKNKVLYRSLQKT